jgi:chromosome partitioning protein
LAHVIALANQKGGVGKTTTTINLGAYLAKAGRRVLIVDLDPQGNTTSGLGVDRRAISQDLYHVLLDGEPASKIIQKTPFNDLAVLPASPVLAAAEVELVGQAAREFKLKRALRDVADTYDFILIDCPPSLGLLTVNGLVAANSVIIPVQAEFYALEGLGQLIQTIGRVRQGLNPQLDILGVLLTMHNGRTTLSGQVHEEVKKHFNEKVFDVVIPRNVRLAEAPSYGKPISHFDKWSKGAKGYKELAQEVIKRSEAVTKGQA